MSILFLAQREWPAQWKDSIFESLTALWTKVAEFIPNLVGMMVILIIGYLVSHVLRKITTTVLHKLRLDSASLKVGLQGTLENVGVHFSASEIVGKLVFWLFMLTFLISAAETLGLENVSQTIDSFVAYLPNVIAAVIIVIVGLMLAQFVSSIVQTGAESIGLDYSKGLARTAYGVLVVVVGTLGIDQLGIETTLINRLLEIVLIAGGAALALSLGLGSRDVARNIVAGVYARDLYKPTSRITLTTGENGVVECVGAISTKIRASDNTIVHIPNGQLIEAIIREDTRAGTNP